MRDIGWRYVVVVPIYLYSQVDRSRHSDTTGLFRPESRPLWTTSHLVILSHYCAALLLLLIVVSASLRTDLANQRYWGLLCALLRRLRLRL